MEIIETKLTQKEVLTLFSVSGMGINPVMSEEEFAKKLSEKAFFLLVKEENKIIGFCAFYKNTEDKFIYISLLWVEEKNRSKGIGRKILDYFDNTASLLFNTIKLEVLKENNRAFLFYKKAGFQIKEDRGEKLLLEKRI